MTKPKKKAVAKKAPRARRAAAAPAPVPGVKTEALAAALGTTPRQVYRWVKKGCPFTVEKKRPGARGRRAHLFDALEVKAWLISQGIAPKIEPDAEPEPDAGPDADMAPAASPVAANGSLGYEAMIDRLRTAEARAFLDWARAVNAKEKAVICAVKAKSWVDLAEQLRKVEKDQADIRSKREAYVLRDEAETAFARMASEIKEALLALPRSTAPRVEMRSAAEVEIVLDDEIRGVLSLLAEKFRGG